MIIIIISIYVTTDLDVRVVGQHQDQTCDYSKAKVLYFSSNDCSMVFSLFFLNCDKPVGQQGVCRIECYLLEIAYTSFPLQPMSPSCFVSSSHLCKSDVEVQCHVAAHFGVRPHVGTDACSVAPEGWCQVELQYGLDPISISVLTHWQLPSLVLPTERTVGRTTPCEASCPVGWKRGSQPKRGT